jgi:hypothetical protein
MSAARVRLPVSTIFTKERSLRVSIRLADPIHA